MSKNVESKNTESAENLSYDALIENSIKFRSLKKQLKNAVKLSLTGITNLVVNHEDPCLVDAFLKSCWKLEDLYKETFDIDAVELQKGTPGRGFASQYLDVLIFGGFEEEDSGDGLGVKVPKTNPQNGMRKRKPDGFVNRKEVLTGKTTKEENFKDRLLVIKNIDYCMDFCHQDPGAIDARALWLLDKFRNPSVKMGCRILLVTNKLLKLPFKIRTINFDPVDEYEANHVIGSFVQLYENGGYKIDFTTSQRRQLVRKICGLTYTEAGDAVAEALSTHTETFEGSKEIDPVKALKNLREKVNRNFMEDAVGLTHLTARPWEDYICPESSNFTYDVNKIVRDFNEIDKLKKEIQEKSKIKADCTVIEKDIDGIRGRMPHVIVLYGKGGVGKCLGKGTPVIMFNGSTKKVEDVTVGDLLMGPDSKPRTVLSTNYGVGPLYRVSQKNGDDYICNDKHILSLKKEGLENNKGIVFVSVEDYLEKNKTWKNTHYGWKSGVEFIEKPLPIDPYWLGLWLGDGNSHKTSITVADKDREIGEWLLQWADRNGAFIRKEKGRGAESWNFAYRKGSGFSINPVLNSLRKLEIYDNKHIPDIYIKNSLGNRLDLLAGLIDSDGYKCESGTLQFTSVNKKMAEQVLYLVRSVGLKGFWNESVKGSKSRNYFVNAYTISIGGNLSCIPIKLARKKGNDNPQKKSLKCGININYIGDGEYFGFTIDGDNQFLLGDFTVTHNSAFPIHFAGLLDFDVWDFNIGASHSKWVGEGPERMREALAKISKGSHLVVRIDEYDRAIGSTESSGQGMHEAHKQVEAEFMNWLQNSQEDNFFIKNDIFLILTTNHKENITGPLLRSGRADLVIDIADFDEESMRETFLSAPRRMSNRGVVVVGFDTALDLEKAIKKLDLDKIIPLSADKGFTVRDVDVMLQEMATHNYYHKKNRKGIPWTTDSFVKVLERSVGSINHEGTTGELILGDRFLLEEHEKKFDPQLNFEFLKDYTNEFDLDEFKSVSFFE